MLYSYCPQMLAKAEWNLAGRTAFDAMEKAAHAIDHLSGIGVKKRGRGAKSHEYELTTANLDLLPLIAWQVDADPSNSVSLFVEKHRSPETRLRFYKCVCGVFTRLAGGPVPTLDGLTLVKDGSTIRVASGSQLWMAITDTAAGTALDGHWSQFAIDSTQLATLNKHLEPLQHQRNLSAYYGESYSREKAVAICEDGRSLFTPIKQRIGHLRGSDSN